MRILRQTQEWKTLHSGLREQKLSIGFVPTMGALHEGHASLIRRARRECERVSVSIYVNETQFDDQKDLQKYPAQLKDDIGLLESLGVDQLLLPSFEAIYPEGYRYRVEEHRDALKYCGASREGHFTGVLTVVLKLLQLTCADRAYFGEKDWQQYRLIEGMCRAFFLDTRIIPCEIIREPSGLACSSRNELLTADQRKKAALLYQLISSDREIREMKELLRKEGFIIDYLETWEDRLLAAVYLGKVRLIDNVRTNEG